MVIDVTVAIIERNRGGTLFLEWASRLEIRGDLIQRHQRTVRRQPVDLLLEHSFADQHGGIDALRAPLEILDNAVITSNEWHSCACLPREQTFGARPRVCIC